MLQALERFQDPGAILEELRTFSSLATMPAQTEMTAYDLTVTQVGTMWLQFRWWWWRWWLWWWWWWMMVNDDEDEGKIFSRPSGLSGQLSKDIYYSFIQYKHNASHEITNRHFLPLSGGTDRNILNLPASVHHTGSSGASPTGWNHSRSCTTQLRRRVWASPGRRLQ